MSQEQDKEQDKEQEIEEYNEQVKEPTLLTKNHTCRMCARIMTKLSDSGFCRYCEEMKVIINSISSKYHKAHGVHN